MNVEYYKGRTLDLTKPVRVYKNLNNGKFSVQQDGKVVCYADHVNLHEISFKVSEAGRQRVIKERQKNVHAYACGKVIDFNPLDDSIGCDVTYDPYKAGYFFFKDDELEVIPKQHDVLHCSIERVCLI